MSRDIRFRAWHKDLEVMLYPPGWGDSMTLCRPHVTIDIDGEQVWLSASMVWDGRWYVKGRYQNVVFQQYTGLKDQDGKEIYEGDILDFHWVEYQDSKGNYVISWDKKRASFECDKLPDASNFMTSSLWGQSKIVGNIYENPELLGVDNTIFNGGEK